MSYLKVISRGRAVNSFCFGLLSMVADVVVEKCACESENFDLTDLRKDAI